MDETNLMSTLKYMESGAIISVDNYCFISNKFITKKKELGMSVFCDYLDSIGVITKKCIDYFQKDYLIICVPVQSSELMKFLYIPKDLVEKILVLGDLP